MIIIYNRKHGYLLRLGKYNLRSWLDPKTTEKDVDSDSHP